MDRLPTTRPSTVSAVIEDTDWMDLSGAEVRARLMNRGVPEDVATQLEYRREIYASDISEILSR